jgi:hypothetical protein
MFGVNKKVKGRALWAMGLSVLCSIKKALSMVPKLSPRIAITNKNCAIISYASGKNESFFMQFIDNGMFALTINDGETIIVEVKDRSNNDDVIIGPTSAYGMPVINDHAHIDNMCAKTADSFALKMCNWLQGQVTDQVDVQVGDNNFTDVVDVVDGTVSTTWDPFGGVKAPEGFTYIGKLAFICFGPTSKYFVGTLAMGGQSNRSVEEKKERLRKVQLIINTERSSIDREIGDGKRGMSMQARMQCAFMAQNEEDADQHHRDMGMIMLTKPIDLTERLVGFLKMMMLDRISGSGSEVQIFISINILVDKLEKLHKDLDAMVTEKRTTNPIVGNVLNNAAQAIGFSRAVNAMGFPEHNGDYDKDSSLVSGLQ